MNKLRASANGAPSQPGWPAGSDRPTNRCSVRRPSGNDRGSGDVTWSTRLGAERSVGLDIRSETMIRADGKVEVRATPVFDARPDGRTVKVDLIPGRAEYPPVT